MQKKLSLLGGGKSGGGKERRLGIKKYIFLPHNSTNLNYTL
jgi:hypothetical protein